MATAKPGKRKTASQRDLDLEISFFEGLIRRAPDYVEALQLLGDGYTRRGRFDDGLRVDELLVKLQPNDPLIRYNLACSYSLTGRMESAFATLNYAIDRGYRDFLWLAEDPDLAPFRETPFYRRLRTRILSLQVKVE